MSDGVGGDPFGLAADDADQLLREARAFVADEAGLLAALAGVLDELADAEAVEAEQFDTDAMWARVQAALWPNGDDRPADHGDDHPDARS